MTRRVPISDLVPANGRTCKLDDQQLTELAASIRDGAMRNPILVFENMNGTSFVNELVIIDGLARIEACKMLGLTTIEVLEVSNLDEACAILEKLRNGVELPTQRQFELYQAMHPLMMRRKRNTRREGIKAPLGYEVLIRATGSKTSDHLKNLVVTYNRVLRMGKEGAILLAEIQEGPFKINSLRRRLDKLEAAQRMTKAEGGAITKPSEQVELVQSIGRSVLLSVRAGARIAVPSTNESSTFSEALAQLRIARRELSTFIHRLEKGAT